MGKQRANLIRLLCAAIFLSVASLPASAGIVYVNATATGGNNGSSWPDAYTDLQSALVPAVSGTSIWVAEGTYRPTSGVDPTATFQLKNGVALCGGFAGTEMALDERDWAANVTILSGNWYNSYHVVTGSGTDSTAVLDGFTVIGGNADGNVLIDMSGGGMLIASGRPTVINVIFSGNWAVFFGGGMYNSGGSSPRLVNVAFWDNSAWVGGGMANFEGSSPRLVNVTFWDNSANQAGGMFNQSSSPTLTNTILWGDSATNGWNEIANSVSSTPTVSYSLIEGCGGSGSWNPYFGTDGGNNIDADPQFVDAAGGDLRLRGASPAVNAGNNAALPPSVTTDLRGYPRIVGGAVDIGAYEYHEPVIYVDGGATGANNGWSWADAYTDLQSALTTGVAGDSIWVAAGTYKPTAGSDRAATFQLKDGVALYGGFAGTEETLEERDWVVNVTVLSGDIGVEGVATDNSYHVVTGSGTNSTAVIDGFMVAKGRADGGSNNNYGGGMFTASGTPKIVNVVFSGNVAFHLGGGMYNWGGSPALTNVVFWGNSAKDGGGMFNNDFSNPVLTNVTFSGNSAIEEGGGVYNWGSSPTLSNTILWGNSAVTDDVSEIYNYDWIYQSTPVISYSLIEGCGGSGAGWDPTLGIDAGHNKDADPLFVEAMNGNLRLSTGYSPAVNAGDNAALPQDVTADLDGNPRIFGCTVDMGAYEFQNHGPVLYVDGKAVGRNDGSCWGDAYTDLQIALAAAVSGDSIWVVGYANSFYMPTSGFDRTATFQLKNGVALFGGFAGTETTLEERNWVARETRLCGDIGVRNYAYDNSYHVVTGSGTDSTAVLDGFIVWYGGASGGGTNDYGGGMYNSYGSPSVRNVAFLGNVGSEFGSGMANLHSHPTLTNVTFGSNWAWRGGGMYNFNSAPTLTNVTFQQNQSVYGGAGMFNESSNPKLTNVSFSVNWNYNWYGENPLGPGIYNSNSSPTLANSILWGDSLHYGVKEIFNDANSHPLLSYSIIRGSGGSGSGWDTSLGVDGGHNKDSDPLFVDMGIWTADLHLSSGYSPAVNAGYNAALPPGINTDRDGNPRIVAGTVDMGAYEYQTLTAIETEDRPRPFQIVSVSPNPFNPSTTIRFTLPAAMPVTAGVWSVTGARVRLLATKQHFGPGDNQLVWDGRNDQGSPAASGVYFVRIETQVGTKVTRAVLLK